MKLAVVAEATLEEQERRARRLQAGARRVHQPQAAGARRRPPGFAAKADFLIMEEKFKAFQKKELKFGSKPEQIKKTFDSFTAEAKQLNEDYQKIWNYKDATWTLASFLRTGDVYYEFAQKLIKAADNPPDDLKKLAKQACKAEPRRLRHRRGPVQGRHLPVRHARSRTRPRSAGRTRWRARRSSASPTTTSRRRARTCRSTCPTSSRSSRTSASDWSTHEKGTDAALRRCLYAVVLAAACSSAGAERWRTRGASRRPRSSPRRRRRRPSSSSSRAATPTPSPQAKAALNKNERYTPAMLVMAKSFYKLHKYEWMKKLWEMMQANGASDAEKSEIYQLLGLPRGRPEERPRGHRAVQAGDRGQARRRHPLEQPRGAVPDGQELHARRRPSWRRRPAFNRDSPRPI